MNYKCPSCAWLEKHHRNGTKAHFCGDEFSHEFHDDYIAYEVSVLELEKKEAPSR